jgi:hypothetical protein
VGAHGRFALQHAQQDGQPVKFREQLLAGWFSATVTVVEPPAGTLTTLLLTLAIESAFTSLPPAQALVQVP